MATGGGAPCFFDNIDYMNKHGIVFFLNPPIGQIGRRMMGRKGNQRRPLLKDFDDGSLFAELEAKLQTRLPYYMKARFEIEVGLDQFELRIQRIVEHLESLEK
jgi:shikimate kinase